MTTGTLRQRSGPPVTSQAPLSSNIQKVLLGPEEGLLHFATQNSVSCCIFSLTTSAKLCRDSFFPHIEEVVILLQGPDFCSSKHHSRNFWQTCLNQSSDLWDPSVQTRFFQKSWLQAVLSVNTSLAFMLRAKLGKTFWLMWASFKTCWCSDHVHVMSHTWVAC